MSLRGVLLAAVVMTAFAAGANELVVEPRSVQVNDFVTITVTTEGAFASLDSLDVPVRNLTLVGRPSISSNFSWVNGVTRRTKVFRYRARPLGAGAALVGPVVLTSDDGQRDTLRAVAVQVLENRAAGSNDAAVVLRELQAAGRDPLFVVAEAEKQSVFVGEPLLVTWWLYNAAIVQEWQVVSVPKLNEFWTEERPRQETPERVFVGDVMMERLPVRRAVLVPLRSGTHSAGGVTIEAAVMRQSRRGPFDMFEGELAELSYTSAPVTVNVKAIPAGPPVDAVGDLVLRCEPAAQQNGPIVVRVTLAGNGNLRAATAPHFDRRVPGTLRIEGGEVSVSRDEPFSMTRQWRYLIFPSSGGMLEVPPLSMTIFDPATASRRELRCASSFVNAVATKPPSSEGVPKAVAPQPRRRVGLWVAVVLLLAAGAVAAIPRIRRALALRAIARDIVRDATPQEIRARVEQRVHIDINEPSDRGDAWRALRSLLDAAERDRDIATDSAREIERRVRDVLAFERK